MYDAEFYKYNVFFHNYKGTSETEIGYSHLLELLDNCLMWLHWKQADLYTWALFEINVPFKIKYYNNI